MGGAETAARQLAEHLRAQTELGGRGPHDLRARRPSPGPTSWSRGRPRSTGCRCTATPPRTAGCPTSTASTGPCAWPPAGRHASRRNAGSTTTGRSRPSWSTPCARRTPTSSPSTRTSTTPPWRPSARSGCRRCCTRRRTTSRRSTCRCSAAPSGTRTPSASTPRRSARSSSGCTRWPSAPRSCSGSAWASPRARAGPAASCWGSGSVPTSSAWGGSTSTRAPRCWRRTSPPTRSAIPDRWPWPWSARSRCELPPHPDIVVTGPGGRARQVGHRARRPGGGVALRARVVLPRGGRGVGRPGARPGQRRLRADPRALRAFGRRAVVHLLPRVRGGAGPARLRRRAARRARGARAGTTSSGTSGGRCSSRATTEFLTTVVERGRGTPGLF